jgi:hypothetical protein
MNKIYILEINGTYKIGRTKNIKQRLMGLQTAVPEKIKVINEYNVENNVIIERYIHHLLRKYRVRGEFFNCSIEHIRNVIDKIITMELLEDNNFSRILRNNFEKGSSSDYVQLKDIRKLFREHKISTDLENVINVLKNVFEYSEFYIKKKINYKQIKSLFMNIKSK